MDLKLIIFLIISIESGNIEVYSKEIPPVSTVLDATPLKSNETLLAKLTTPLAINKSKSCLMLQKNVRKQHTCLVQTFGVPFIHQRHQMENNDIFFWIRDFSPIDENFNGYYWYPKKNHQNNFLTICSFYASSTFDTILAKYNLTYYQKWEKKQRMCYNLSHPIHSNSVVVFRNKFFYLTKIKWKIFVVQLNFANNRTTLMEINGDYKIDEIFIKSDLNSINLIKIHKYHITTNIYDIENNVIVGSSEIEIKRTRISLKSIVLRSFIAYGFLYMNFNETNNIFTYFPISHNLDECQLNGIDLYLPPNHLYGRKNEEISYVNFNSYNDRLFICTLRKNHQENTPPTILTITSKLFFTCPSPSNSQSI
ncbi:hypothetical protein SNEBB_004814 [Seison nebaliae]|nr:hypothetical protein SNEBB_004814 [Seison nebaliae]